MQANEIDWLQEMLRLSGVEDEDEYSVFLPGMLPLEEEDEIEEERRAAFRLAEEQTWELIAQQERMNETDRETEDED